MAAANILTKSSKIEVFTKKTAVLNLMFQIRDNLKSLKVRKFEIKYILHM